ncbi:MAG: FGGY-family carbohydrate kinase [Anaerolineales bacterium]|nr:FGGY-family carbohydrate kinase [Anaerolineales bacterium]
MAASVPPGSGRLIFLPWLSGEHAPVLDHYARGGYVGLTMSHNKAHMTRAVMEGVAYHTRWICEWRRPDSALTVSSASSAAGIAKSEPRSLPI